MSEDNSAKISAWKRPLLLGLPHALVFCILVLMLLLGEPSIANQFWKTTGFLTAYLLISCAFTHYENSRLDDYGEEYPEAATLLFIEVAKKFELDFEVHEQGDVEVSITLPKQNGLDYEIWLCLQHIDELWFIVEEMFTCSLFPFEEKRDEFRRNLEGFLSGEFRILTYRRPKSGRTVKSLLQMPIGDGWKTIYEYHSGWSWWPFDKPEKVIVKSK